MRRSWSLLRFLLTIDFSNNGNLVVDLITRMVGTVYETPPRGGS